MRDDPLSECRLCGRTGKVRRKIGTGAGIIFKGGGFYETDFKDRKGKAEEPAPAKAAESTPTGGGEKTVKSEAAKPSPSTSASE